MLMSNTLGDVQPDRVPPNVSVQNDFGRLSPLGPAKYRWGCDGGRGGAQYEGDDQLSSDSQMQNGQNDLNYIVTVVWCVADRGSV